MDTMDVVAVGFDSDGKRSMLGFAASEDNPDDVLVVARSLKPDAQEIALGMDTYCVITGSSGATYYGGLDEVEWPKVDRLRLRLSRDAAEALMLPRQFELVLPDAAAVALVQEQLPALLA